VTTSPLIVLERALAVHHALSDAGVRHAFGGALALAYHVAEARATNDIDVNVTSDPRHPETVFRLLPDGVLWSDADVDAAVRDGQVRLWWPHPDPDRPPVPLDIFLPQHEYHAGVDARTEWVPLLGEDVPIVSATDLTVFKVLFDRSKDWPDIEAMLDRGKVDVDLALEWTTVILGRDDPRIERLRVTAALTHERRDAPPPTFGSVSRPRREVR
jgi:hypothetical protein